MCLPFGKGGRLLRKSEDMATNESNTVSLVLQGSASATALAFFSDSIMKMIPWLIVAVPIIALDLVWGVRAAKCRGEKIRFSRGFRRTFGKFFEYICWIVLASTMTLAFQMPWIEWAVLGIVILNELSSIIGNYLETKGMKVNWRYLLNTGINLGGQKFGVDASGVDTAKFIEPIKKPKPGRNIKGQYVSKGGKK